MSKAAVKSSKRRDLTAHSLLQTADHCRSSPPSLYCATAYRLTEWMALNRCSQQIPAACSALTPLNSLDRKDSLETGRQLFLSLAFSPLFVKSERTTARLKSDGKQPVTSDLLNNRATNGASIPLISLTSQVRTGSSWHVLFSYEPICLSTSSAVTAVQLLSVDVTLCCAGRRTTAS